MDKRSPEDIRKSIKSLVEEAESVSVNSEENIEVEKNEMSLNDENKLSDEIEKLNNLLKDGVLTKEEFEKAKKKLLDN